MKCAGRRQKAGAEDGEGAGRECCPSGDPGDRRGCGRGERKGEVERDWEGGNKGREPEPEVWGQRAEGTRQGQPPPAPFPSTSP